MIILAVETSCDETSVAILKYNEKTSDNSIEVLSNIVLSQIDIHTKFGGVVPEIASRQHAKNISYVLEEALTKAKISLDDISAVAVTKGPGLVGALLVGVSFAKALAYSLNIPLIPVHHIAGHIFANYITHKEIKPPHLALVVSGGHSHIILVEDYTKFKILAKTRDDAAGEAFDKVARTLNLGYPGGPKISKMAEKGEYTYKLPTTKFDNSYDFSFSGIKTAVINICNKEKDNLRISDLCTSFEQNVTDVLVKNTINLAKELNIKDIALAGGVAANKVLRKKLKQEGANANINIYLPDLRYTTDNAAMIASYGIYKYLAKKYTTNLDINAVASMSIEEE